MFPRISLNLSWSKSSVDKSPALYEEIIKENPKIKITPILDSGIKLKIPVLEEFETIKFKTPPWKK